MLSDPVAQVPLTAYDAVIVADPATTNEAVLPEKVRIEVLLDVHVVLPVTSVPFRIAVNACEVPAEKVPLGGLITSVCALPPVVLPVIVPCTPASVAVMVTLEVGPTAVTSPVVLTVAQELELDQLAWLVTILVPLL